MDTLLQAVVILMLMAVMGDLVVEVVNILHKVLLVPELQIKDMMEELQEIMLVEVAVALQRLEQMVLEMLQVVMVVMV